MVNAWQSKCYLQVHITIICVIILVLEVVWSASVIDYNHIHDSNKNAYRNVSQKRSKYTIDDLLSMRFESKISDDIDVDPCKSGKYYSYNYYRMYIANILTRLRY